MLGLWRSRAARALGALVFGAALAVTLAACGGAGGSGDDAAGVDDPNAVPRDEAQALSDRTAPTLAISVPTSAASFTASAATLALGGTVSDNRSVARVTWLNDRGGSGVATLTRSTTSRSASFAVTALPLAQGVNNIRVSAYDNAGNRSSKTLSVSYAVAAPAPPPPTTPPTAPLVTLAITLAGSGTVTSAPAGIDCGTSCSASFAANTLVTLTATPAAGWSFAGWTGGNCNGVGSCAVSLAQATTVSANFTAVTVASYAVQLAWSASSDASVVGYKVYHALQSGAWGSDTQQVATPAASFGPVATGTHFFAVTALDSAGNESPKSAELAVTVP